MRTVNDVIWCCTYANAQGVDVSVYDKRVDAQRGAVLTMLSGIRKMTDKAVVDYLMQLVESELYDEAFSAYRRVTNESFVIEAKPVTTISPKTLEFGVKEAKDFQKMLHDAATGSLVIGKA